MDNVARCRVCSVPKDSISTRPLTAPPQLTRDDLWGNPIGIDNGRNTIQDKGIEHPLTVVHSSFPNGTDMGAHRSQIKH
ncbi:hypothetical protein DAKH74_040960 [Maudiozyma humilis]|uniref:Uncharacterized protein n=1 Tax=Maudiozyma humilis TaxID=51915 RepID=A0AAV5S1E3_MAUHU|nr:hypothetical protein DAKH74_040960 [Kazachstania humilis]